MPPKQDTKKTTKSDSKKDGKPVAKPNGIVNLDEDWLWHNKK